MSKIHWDKDPVGLGNGRVGYHTDPVTGEFTLVHSGDSRPVMNINKKMRNAYEPGSMAKQSWHNVANLDMGAIAHFKGKYGTRHLQPRSCREDRRHAAPARVPVSEVYRR